MKAVSAMALPHRDEVKGPYPTLEEPSDHVLLAAEMDFGS